MITIKNTDIFKKLLCYGLFPERLSSILTAKNFGEWAILNDSKININNDISFGLLSYKLTRNNNSPRYLGIPGPFGYIRLCRTISQNWNKIQKKINKCTDYETISMILAKLDNQNSRLFSMQSYDSNPDEEKLVLEKQLGKKYFVHLDIANYFPSIYTHSIPWSLVGKKIAKKNSRKNDTYYNKLDKNIRDLQDRQTVGLPVGPDTSFLLSELLLSQIDCKLRSYSYIRYIDDYKCYCVSKEEAESFIRDLTSNLEYYGLKLNTKKTKISTLPYSLNGSWVRTLRQFFDRKYISKYEKTKIIDFLDLASDLFRSNPDESPIRYALEVLKNKNYADYDSYELVLRYFLNLCFLYPYVIDIADDLVRYGIKRFMNKQQVIKSILRNSLIKILNEHITYDRSDAISWSIFLAIKYDLDLPFARFAKKISKTNDCIPNLMAYLYAKVNRLEIDSFKKLIKNVDPNEWWLFIYEVSRIEKIRIKDDLMNTLRNKNITFLSNDLTSKLNY